MAHFDESILFVSAFGQPCNKTYSGTATNEKFRDIVGDGWFIAPWTSATPLSGELLQCSLDALLQNDINLLSAYPDAYLKPNSGDSINMERITYSPTGIVQNYNTGESGWINSMTVSAEIGTVGGEANNVMLGAFVPATPFKPGDSWTCGLFGVKDGEPTWFTTDIESIESGVKAQEKYNTVSCSIIVTELTNGSLTVDIDKTIDSITGLKDFFDSTNGRIAHILKDDSATYVSETVVPINWRVLSDESAMFVEFIGQNATDLETPIASTVLYVLKFSLDADRLVGNLFSSKKLS